MPLEHYAGKFECLPAFQAIPTLLKMFCSQFPSIVCFPSVARLIYIFKTIFFFQMLKAKSTIIYIISIFVTNLSWLKTTCPCLSLVLCQTVFYKLAWSHSPALLWPENVSIETVPALWHINYAIEQLFLSVSTHFRWVEDNQGHSVKLVHDLCSSPMHMFQLQRHEWVKEGTQLFDIHRFPRSIDPFTRHSLEKRWWTVLDRVVHKNVCYLIQNPAMLIMICLNAYSNLNRTGPTL